MGTFFLRVSPQTALARLEARGTPLEKFETEAILARIAVAYEEALSLPLGGDIHIVDGEVDIDTVAATVRQLVDETLDKHRELL